MSAKARQPREPKQPREPREAPHTPQRPEPLANGDGTGAVVTAVSDVRPKDPAAVPLPVTRREAPAPGPTHRFGTAEEAPPGGPSRWWVWLIVLAVLAVGGFFAWRHFHAAGTDTATPGGPGGRRGGGTVPVVAATVRRGDLPLYLTGLGTVTPLNTVTVRSRVDGQITAVSYTEGQYVKEGQELVQIDPRPFQVQLAQARGQLAKDQATLQDAEVELQRYQSAADAVSRQQVDTQLALVNQLKGATQIDQAQIDAATLNITYSKVTAPISGRIGLRLVDVGNIIHSGDSSGIAVINQIQPISVVFTLPQEQIARVIKAMDANPNLPVDAFDRDIKQRLAAGTLSAVDNQVDPTTGTVRLKATFPNENNGLFPNEFVNARMLVETVKGATLVPAAAVQRGPDSTFAYVVKGDAVDLRTITVGPMEDDQAVIESGLQPGEVVVTDGVDKLVKGSKVSVQKQHGSSTRPSTNPSARGGKGGHGQGQGAQEGEGGKAGDAAAPAGAGQAHQGHRGGATAQPNDQATPAAGSSNPAAPATQPAANPEPAASPGPGPNPSPQSATPAPAAGPGGATPAGATPSGAPASGGGQ